jgi:hypothetical protein
MKKKEGGGTGLVKFYQPTSQPKKEKKIDRANSILQG